MRLESGEVDCVVTESFLGVITHEERSIAGAEALSTGQLQYLTSEGESQRG